MELGKIHNENLLKDKKLLVIVPCRERPKVLKEFIHSFAKTTSTDTQVLFCLDEDDPELKNYMYHVKPYPYVINKRMTITKIFNKVAIDLLPDFKFYMPCNDDFVFHTKIWDQHLMKVIEDRGGWGIAYGDDKIQGQNMCTTSVISGNIIRSIGWLQMPDLTHLFGDNVWLTIGQMIERIYFCEDVVIEHNHFINKKAEVDNVYKRTNSQEMYQKDGEAFKAWSKFKFNEADKIFRMMYKDRWNEKTISVCMIVGDFEPAERLKKCLDSIKGYVDEIQIQFNYKRWKNMARLNKLLKVLPLHPKVTWKYEKWVDFSTNRNQCLEMATKDYILSLDADDMVKTPYLIKDYIYRFPEADYFKCQVHSFTEVKGKELILQNRLYKNGKGYKYVNNVHEDISFSMLDQGAKLQVANIQINHYGNLSIKDLARKNIRNLKLVLEDMKKPTAHSLTYFALVNCLVMKGSHTTFDFYCTTDKVFRFFRKPLAWLGVKKYLAKKSFDSYFEAVQTVDKCFEKFPPSDDDPLTRKMWVLRGLACLHAGQREAAWDSFNKAYSIKQDAEAAINLAYLYVEDKKWQKVIDILIPIFDKGGFDYGNLPYDVVEMEAAILKDLGIAYYNLMLELMAKETKTQEENQLIIKYSMNTIEFYKKFLGMSPGNLEVIDQLCNCLRTINRHAEAAQLTVQAVNKFPHYGVGWYNLAQTELINKRYLTAKVFLDRAYQVSKSPEILHNLQQLEAMGVK